MTYVTNEESFLRDVAEHQVQILRDDGVYRHIRFKRPSTSDMHFDMITWPWCLCYTGDMGTYVFRRLEDMFQFFRAGRCQFQKGHELRINPGYWAEKVEGADCHDGIKEYRAEKFRARITEWIDDMGASPELREAVEDEILSCADEGEHEARRAVRLFEHNGEDVFQDFQEIDLTEYTHRFMWCCYALAWGIQKYDDAKKEAGHG
jgi:hypothetical protein